MPLSQSVIRWAAPDGYTFFWAGTGTISIYPAMHSIPYNSTTDLLPVAMIGTSPQVLVVNPELPIKSVSEFVFYVKARSGQRSYAGTGGAESVSNLLMATFLKRLGLHMQSVTYRGSANALTDVIGGHVPTMFIPMPEALPQAQDGRIRILAIADDQRDKRAPNVPTPRETGYPGFGELAGTECLLLQKHRQRS